MDKVAIDLLIEAEWVIPVQPHGVVLEDYAVAVDHGRIVALLPSVDARQRYAPRETVSRPGHALIPGLVNSHCHSAMVLSSIRPPAATPALLTTTSSPPQLCCTQSTVAAQSSSLVTSSCR